MNKCNGGARNRSKFPQKLLRGLDLKIGCIIELRRTVGHLSKGREGGKGTTQKRETLDLRALQWANNQIAG